MKRNRQPLPDRAQRIVDEHKDRERRIVGRFEEILCIMSSADDLGYVHRLAAAARDGLKPGEIEWSFTSRLIEHKDIRGFCGTCGKGLNGKGCEVSLFADNCPAEIGILKYAGCSANA